MQIDKKANITIRLHLDYICIKYIDFCDSNGKIG